MNYAIIIAQILGILGMAGVILSMQCRSNKNFFIVQGTAGLLFAVSFGMLNAWAGALMNIFSLVRAWVLNNQKIAKSKVTLILLILALILCTGSLLYYFKEKWYLVLIVFIAQMISSFAMWSQNGKIIRHTQLIFISPLWLTYNFIIPIPSIGGILTETLTMISVAVALIRYRKIGFTK